MVNEVFEVVFDRSPPVYVSGEAVTGRVLFEAQGTIEVRSLCCSCQGTLEVSFRESTSKRKYSKTVEYVAVKSQLEEEGRVLHSGTRHSWSFRFNLPATCPSSFDVSEAKVKYSVNVVLSTAKWFSWNKKAKGDFMVKGIIDPVDPNLLVPVSCYKETSSYICCFPRSSSSAPPSSVNLQLSSGFLSPGDLLTVNLSCSNGSNGRSLSCRLCLIQRYRVTGETVCCPHSPVEHRWREVKVVQQNHDPILPRSSRTWNAALYVPHDAAASTVLNGEWLTISYEVKVVVSNGWCRSCTAKIPLVVGEKKRIPEADHYSTTTCSPQHSSPLTAAASGNYAPRRESTSVGGGEEGYSPLFSSTVHTTY
eukprot:GHVS01005534.1.p1 GENE.GHVS01005534.1~~GHVS01005534.1.p1  ORF type:complete len:364 (-),score=48.35 GHVS01005534.1:326-1417(-)